MQLVVSPDGSVRCVYGETIDLAALVRLTIARGSHVEPDENGRGFANLAPVGGPQLGPFRHRSDALIAEAAWLDAHWLPPASSV